MREISAPAHFLLLLRPGVAKLDFIAVADTDRPEGNELDVYVQAMDKAFDDVLEEILRLGQIKLEELSDTATLFALCNQIVERAKNLQPALSLVEQLIRAVAVRWLEQDSLPLGDAPDSSSLSKNRWRILPNSQAQLRFQDAIDWYAGYGCSINNAVKAGDGNRYIGYDELRVTRNSNTILKVPMSASRPNIVTLSNLKMFLAEHLLAYDKYAVHMQEPNGNNAPPGLTFFFLPIKGLGQCRAAIDWVGVDGYKLSSDTTEMQLLNQASTLHRLGLESLFSQSLIRSFSVSLRKSFLAKNDGRDQSPDDLYQVFADLWWANEVRFVKAGRVVNRLIRAEGETDLTWLITTDKPSSLNTHWVNYNGSYKGFFSTAGKSHPDLTYIKLNIASFIDPANDINNSVTNLLSSSGISYQDLSITINALPFDTVLFACYFFEPLKEDLAEWVDQLADAIVSTLIEQTIQRNKIVRSRAKTLERAAHWLNGLVRLVGRVDAAVTLNKIIDQLDAGHELRGGLERVNDSLELLVLVEAGTGLLRLYGTLDDNDYEHVRDWFTETSRAEWKKTSAFQTYQSSITHLARAIASASGYPRIDVSVNGNVTLYTDNIKLELDNMRFPPLSKARKGNEPILALLPSLTEPLDNAIKYLKAKSEKGLNISENPIKLIIEDRRSGSNPCILVEIGNPYFEGEELPATPGLARARELVDFTGLASIGEGQTRTVDGKSYYFVPVYLHPQRLAEKIDKNSHEPSTKKAQASHHR